ncbi:SCO family protein [Amorphus orientalis]|uniref:Protein SCO1/2 n=1 Tax=Amorphus orientalis TaxID=649198 RepID=A0AAE3VLX3_9HYPH|nr:SCO family protein [Amorphus orientalis]MDQ0314362.1 protein SCO1/2 [Amorphus orientalis]
MKAVRYIAWGLVVIVAAAAIVASLGWYTGQIGDKPAGVASIGGPFTLVNTDGETVTLADFDDKPRAMFFGFTFCPDVCPTTLYEAGGWLNALGDKADDLTMIYVTVDPERDTPEQMKNYLSSFDPRIVGLTGSQEQVDEAIRNYRVYARKVELDDGGYTMDHTASVMLFDEDGTFKGTIDYKESTQNAVAKLERLVGS